MAFKTWYFQTILVVALLGRNVWSGRILLMPALHHSHVQLFCINGKALQDAGHDVTVLTSPAHKDLVVKHDLKAAINPISQEADFTRWLDNNTNALHQDFTRTLEQMKRTFAKLCEETNSNVLLMTYLADQKFDLVLMDGMAMRHCMYTIPFRLSVPYVVFSTVPDPWSSGVPAMASFEPSVLQGFSNDMTLIQRARTAVNYLMLYWGHLTGDFDVTRLKEVKVDKDMMPSLRQLHHRAEMVLINVEVLCVDYPRVSMPHYQYVGGAAPRTNEKLESGLLDWVNGAPYGVIIVSLGSHSSLQSVWDQLEEKLLEALQRLTKWRAVVQLDPALRRPDAPALPENVLCLPWLPQAALLAHQRARLLVTHGGSNGQMEAIYNAVPMLTIPITGDQFHNAKRIRRRGYGMRADLVSTTADELYSNMLELITNASYRTNARRCSDILRSRPTGPDNVVTWVEHVLRFGGGHLRPPTLDMPLYQLFMFDLVIAAASLGILLPLIVFLSLAYILVYCKDKFKSKKSKTE